MLDQDYRPLAIQDSRSDGLNIGFGFDPVGNLTALTAPGNTAPVVTLGYDNLDRLTAFKDGPTGTVIDGYSYDATGNRLSAQVNGSSQTYSYPTDSHRLASVAGAARSYDAAGNTTAIDGTAREFAYDATGRMSQAKRSGTLAMEYRYNDRGEQVRRFLGTTNTYTLYDEAGHWLGDYDSNGKALQQAIWLDGLPVGVLAGTALNYVQPDHLGAPRTVIDPVRDLAIWKWDIKGEAFGNTPPDQDPDRDSTAFVFGMRFPGQRYDSATGLNQNYFRDYDAGIGRYAQSDPIGLSGGIGTYGYAHSDPLALIDPTGLQAIIFPIGPGMAGAAGAAGAAGGYGSDNLEDPNNLENFGPKVGGEDISLLLQIMVMTSPQNVIDPNGALWTLTGAAVQQACSGNGGDPCKGIRKQLNAHKQKLAEYISNPKAHDNQGLLGKGNDARVISGRISALRKQIAMWERDLAKCEEKNGK